MPHINQIQQHLADALNGEAFPSLTSTEADNIMLAFGVVVCDRDQLAQIGLDTVRQLVARAQSAITAQRECALMIDRGNKLC